MCCTGPGTNTKALRSGELLQILLADTDRPPRSQFTVSHFAIEERHAHFVSTLVSPRLPFDPRIRHAGLVNSNRVRPREPHRSESLVPVCACTYCIVSRAITSFTFIPTALPTSVFLTHLQHKPYTVTLQFIRLYYPWASALMPLICSVEDCGGIISVQSGRVKLVGE